MAKSAAFPWVYDLLDRNWACGPGELVFSVSIFDHFLAEDESVACDLFTIDQAREGGHLAEYLVGEARFLELYRRLAKRGVSRVLRSGCLAPLVPDSRRFGEILVSSLRERSAPRRFMDLYFHGYGLRVFGNWDRTDIWLCRDEAHLAELRTAIADVGLFELTWR